MNALGMIETKGLIAGIEAADFMTKTSQVTLKGIVPVGDGLVTVMVEGELEAVRASVNAGTAAAERIGTVVLSHVIPRPDSALENALASIFHIDPPVPSEKYKEEPVQEEQQIPSSIEADCIKEENETKPQILKEQISGTTLKAASVKASENKKEQAPVPEKKAEKKAQKNTEKNAAKKPAKKNEVNLPEKEAGASESSADLSAYEAMTVSELRAKAREMNVETLSRKDIRFAKKDILLKAIAVHLKNQ